MITKQRLNPSLTDEDRYEMGDRLDDVADELINALGTGNEIIDMAADAAESALKSFKQALYYGIKNEIRSKLAMVELTVGVWVSSLEGNLVVSEIDEQQKASYARARLQRKLEELDEIIADFAKSSTRLEYEVQDLEKSLDEVNELMLSEDNERRLNDLYRQVTTIKSKLETLNIRKSSYNACFNLLDLIRVNGKEILQAGKYSSEDLSKAKVLLNLAKLRVVISDPDKALGVLKMMNKEIERISNKVKAIDNKILSLNGDSANVSADALKYKEELMAKKRAKDTLNEISNDELKVQKDKTIKKVKGE